MTTRFVALGVLLARKRALGSSRRDAPGSFMVEAASEGEGIT
jgi:hypothetical protein